MLRTKQFEKFLWEGVMGVNIRNYYASDYNYAVAEYWTIRWVSTYIIFLGKIYIHTFTSSLFDKMIIYNIN